jgi:type IV pilus assembly protein PilE
MKKSNGFTLIELMIVVTIIAIMASIAYPAYQDQVRASRRADCAGSLMRLAQSMERYFTTNNTYVGAAAAGPPGGPIPAVYSNQCPTDGAGAAAGQATYNLVIQTATASTYTLRAVPVNVQAADDCGTLTLTNTGLKGMIGNNGNVTLQDCW